MDGHASTETVGRLNKTVPQEIWNPSFAQIATRRCLPAAIIKKNFVNRRGTQREIDTNNRVRYAAVSVVVKASP